MERPDYADFEDVFGGKKDLGKEEAAVVSTIYATCATCGWCQSDVFSSLKGDKQDTKQRLKLSHEEQRPHCQGQPGFNIC